VQHNSLGVSIKKKSAKTYGFQPLLETHTKNGEGRSGSIKTSTNWRFPCNYYNFYVIHAENYSNEVINMSNTKNLE
jgi:hypothetical protein